MLTTFLITSSSVAPGPLWKALESFFVLALQTFMLATFVVTNLARSTLLGLMLIPMFLVGVWGGDDRIYADEVFIYTVVGSMLLAVFYLYVLHHEQFGTWSMAFADLMRLEIGLGPDLAVLAFAIGFAVKVPMFPLYTRSRTRASSSNGGLDHPGRRPAEDGDPGSCASVCRCSPAPSPVDDRVQAFVMGIIYGALVAMVPDMKKLVAYSSVVP